ncbi:RICIN domain-containing protein [Catenovulum sediminis]|uniref:RICIN domain-containing protein n=1 Tax=Catenovulum sediminis TaxID=1740262 RepID=UPI00117F7981|nr:RICIN domain-containing protein [Catenovulum sediminis]
MQRNIVAQTPVSLLGTDSDVFRIVNKQGKLLYAQTEPNAVGVSDTVLSDDSDLWQVDYQYPYFYQIKNVKTGLYLEVAKGYTLADLNKPNPGQVLLEQKYNYAGKAELPFWFLKTQDLNNSDWFEIFPGGMKENRV